jgi:CRP/FNR family transcriptional regulator, cyclic AMP receptor protein
LGQLEKILEKIPFFEIFLSADIEKIIPLFTERVYKKKGIPIFFEGDPGEEFFIIKTGAVKIYRLDELKEVILAILHEGSYFGEMAVIQNDQVRSATAETMGPTTLYVLNRKEFIRLLEENPKLTLNLLESAMDRLRKSNELVKDLTTLDARSRIVKTILRLSDEYGVSKVTGIYINIILTHQQMADMAGTVRETVTKTLLELQDEGVIKMERKNILITDLATLRAKVSY